MADNPHRNFTLHFRKPFDDVRPHTFLDHWRPCLGTRGIAMHIHMLLAHTKTVPNELDITVLHGSNVWYDLWDNLRVLRWMVPPHCNWCRRYINTSIDTIRASNSVRVPRDTYNSHRGRNAADNIRVVLYSCVFSYDDVVDMGLGRFRLRHLPNHRYSAHTGE